MYRSSILLINYLGQWRLFDQIKMGKVAFVMF